MTCSDPVRGILTICAILLSLPGDGLASSLSPLGLEDLVVHSEAIVHGSVIGTHSHWNDEHTFIVTDVRLKVHSALKGKPVREIVTTQPGGTVGKMRMEVDGAAEFLVDDEVMLFLSEPKPGAYVLTGLGQGRYDIVEREGTGLKVVIRPTVADDVRSLKINSLGSSPPPLPAQEDVDVFIERIRTLVRTTSRRPR